MAPILGPDGQALAAHGWHDAESIADDGGTLYAESKESTRSFASIMGRMACSRA